MYIWCTFLLFVDFYHSHCTSTRKQTQKHFSSNFKLTDIFFHRDNKIFLKVPFTPFIPFISFFINFYLMITLPLMIWIVLIIWIIIGKYSLNIQRFFLLYQAILFKGFVIYFTYGIRNSLENPKKKFVLCRNLSTEPSITETSRIDSFTEISNALQIYIT